MTTTARLLSGAALGGLLALGAGCTTTTGSSDLNRLVEQAQASAAAAEQAASRAQAAAETAANNAASAQRTANEAQACCNANTDRIDRMLNKVMQK